MDSLHLRAKKLLEKLISIKSFSFNEDKTANHIEKWFNENKIKTSRKKNNVFAFNKYYNPQKPNLLPDPYYYNV